MCCWTLFLQGRKEWFGNAKAGGSLGCDDHEIAEFGILEETINRTAAPDFRRTNSDLFEDLLGGALWVRSLVSKRA